MELKYVIRTTVVIFPGDKETPELKKYMTFCVVDPIGQDHFECFKLILFEECDGRIVREEFPNVFPKVSYCGEMRNLTFNTSLGPISTNPASWGSNPLETLDPNDYEIVDGNLVDKP
ncbi:hypothetical protein [Shimazuella alba]|uniref:Uncharacterized protein n=1 Tax=Shimazuella alba TaxID=2690964 RepID=A0A6I4VNF5_9BACL|nr:hypothetical protein [Shimazuella alba]MXQ53169.1 hypothetical protein [Shimazuella alba]